MARQVVIIGGLPGDPELAELLDRLRARSGDEIEWEWIRAEANDYRPVPKLVNRLLTRLQQGKKPSENPGSIQPITVVKLALLHGQVQNQIHTACDPVLAPRGLSGVDELVDWIFSSEAFVVENDGWYGNVREAALIAVLAKLVKNKSWNKDTQGHAWTKEEDLLCQSPVLRPDFPTIAIEARRLLGRLDGTLLVSKGGTAGTPKEWSIRLMYVPVVKQVIVSHSLNPLSSVGELHQLCRHVEGDDDRPFRMDGEIVNERVRSICRD